MSPHALDALLGPGRALAGLVIATLPPRLWNEWEGRVPVRGMALPAALLAFFLGFGIGIPGFVAYARRAGSAAGDLVLKAGEQVNAGRMPRTAGVYAWYTMVLALPAFAFFTPLGWLSTYLVASGLTRAFCCAADDPRGDPLITGADTLARRWWHRRQERREEEARHALEGAETPDLLLPGRAFGAPEAVYVVVASRLKPDWVPGVLLVTEQGRFRVGKHFDRRLPEGLRAVYPLLEVAALEVTRRAVAYTLPPLSNHVSRLHQA